MGRGWEWRYIPFFLETEQDVTLRLQAIVENARYQWVSICNLRLLYTSELPTAVTSPLSPASSQTRVYTVAGQQASRLHEGVYIVRQADGRSQKVLRGK